MSHGSSSTNANTERWHSVSDKSKISKISIDIYYNKLKQVKSIEIRIGNTGWYLIK